MGKKLPYYKMYPKDFDADEKVRMLDIREAGLYLFALNHSWNNDGLPGDDAEIGKMLKIPVKDFRDAWPAVRKCFTVCEDGRLRNSRQEDERNKALEKSNKTSKSATARWANEDANAMRTHNNRMPFASPRVYESESEYGSSTVKAPEEKKASTREIVSLKEFDRWWETWSAVRGTNHKPDAVQAWLSVMRPEIQAACFECAQSYLDSLDNPAKGYNPETFLFDQAKQKFEARWPKAKARDSPKRHRDEPPAAMLWGGGETISGADLIRELEGK